MAQRRVRFALITFSTPDPKTGRDVPHTHFRGSVVDVPDESMPSVADLDAQGATVLPDVELDRAGSLYELPENVTDEELVHWVGSASKAEIQTLAAQRPDLAFRIDGARMRVAEGARIRDQLLGEAFSTAAQYAPEGSEFPPHADIFVAGQPVGTSVEGDEEEDPEHVVRGTVESISDYLSEHPDQAQAVLDAETAQRSGHPRPGVVKAAETAAQYATR
jgi:hypothetical protein